MVTTGLAIVLNFLAGFLAHATKRPIEAMTKSEKTRDTAKNVVGAILLFFGTFSVFVTLEEPDPKKRFVSASGISFVATGLALTLARIFNFAE